MSDATDKTVAGVLEQEDDQGIQRNIAYLHRKLLPNKRNYSVLEKEALGILASCVDGDLKFIRRRSETCFVTYDLLQK